MAASASRHVKHIFITGNPGVGKTTLVQKVVDKLKKDGIPLGGFITEEVRTGGRRIGFDILSLDGQRGILSRVGSSKPGPHVGQYVVDVKSFEHIALRALELPPAEKSIMVIDEIGKMELYSQSFIKVVRKLLRGDGVHLLGTIPVPKGRPLALVEEIRQDKNVQVFTLTKENRDKMVTEVLGSVRKIFQEGT